MSMDMICQGLIGISFRFNGLEAFLQCIRSLTLVASFYIFKDVYLHSQPPIVSFYQFLGFVPFQVSG